MTTIGIDYGVTKWVLLNNLYHSLELFVTRWTVMSDWVTTSNFIPSNAQCDVTENVYIQYPGSHKEFFFFWTSFTIPGEQGQHSVESACLLFMCTFRKYPYSTHRREWNFLEQGGSIRIKKFKKCMNLDWNLKKKTLLLGDIAIFLNYTMWPGFDLGPVPSMGLVCCWL